MTVSVVELSTVDNAGSGTTAAVTFATAPQPGDVVVLAIFGTSGATTNVPTVSGLGATWTNHVAVQQATTPTGTVVFVVGTGATAAGTVSLTWPVTTNHVVRGFLVRGLSSASVKTASANSGTSTTAFTGPRLPASLGQFALSLFHATNGTTSNSSFPVDPSLPSVAAWTAQGKLATGSNTNDTAYHIPATSGDVGTAASSAGNYYHRQSLLVLGSPVSSGPPSGSATGAFKWSGSASGRKSSAGSGAGSFAWQGASSTVAPAPNSGSGSGSFSWSGVAAVSQRVEAWSADLSRRTRLVLVTSGSIEATPPLELPPAGFVERPILRKSVTVPALNTISGAVVTDMGVRVPDDVYDALPAVVEEVGVPHVIIGNHDVTYFRGGLTRTVSFQAEEPFGDLSATIEVPQITSYDEFPDDSNVHPLNWSRIRANVYIVLKRPDGSQVKVWGGHVVSHDTGNDENGTTKRLTCVGSLWQASTDIHKVPTMLDPTDIGTLVPKALNEVASRRYPTIPKVTTGIMSRQRGSWSDSPLAYAQGLLATAFTAGGNQWTVAKVPNTWRRYEMRKKSEAPSWTVTNGARGVTVDLTRDGAAVRNVIYGHGVGPDGYAWWNYHYPNLRMDDAPVFPGVIMSAGSTDANSNGGVSLWQARARDLGYHVDVDGTLTSGDVTTIKALQRKYGLQVDGQIGPQTWAATFDVGGNGGDLSGAIRLPLAADPRTQKWLYNGDGSIAGPNPDYDKNHIIHAADIDYGSGRTREEGLEDSQLIVEREKDPAITGRIVLRSDPREGSRILIRPGDKLRLIGYEGADRVLHIARVDFDMDSQAMTLEVDERGRDAMTLTEIRERNKDARRDPARRPGNVNRRSRLDVDSVVPFDGESGAGRIPRFAVYGGLWSVIRVPVSSLGRIASVDVSTSSPAAEFVMGLFGKPVTPAHLLREVGNPLAFDDPFNKNPAQAARLDDDLGFIEGFGSKSSPAGYWPKQKGDGPLTGKLVDTGGVEYVSAKPPWVWVAVYSPTSTFIFGRLLPAPIQ